MLVLSRRTNETIVFPNIGVRIRILRMHGNAVRVGIEAPADIEILRQEIVNGSDRPSEPGHLPAGSHTLRNRLNKVTLGLYHLHQQWQAGLLEQANATLLQALDTLETLDREWSEVDSGAKQRQALPPRRCRTLVVEDDDNERELLAGILGMNGCDCQTVADGQDALDYLASHELPDFVLLDMGLPRVNGPQMLARIRSEPRCEGLKVFAISGTSPHELGIVTGPGGVDAWFTKPLNPRRLWEALQQGMASRPAAN